MLDSVANTVYGVLTDSATKHADHPAILAAGRPAMTYGALLEHIESLRGQLHTMGLGPASRLAIVLPNGAEAAVAFLAAASSAVAAPLNPAYRESELRFYLADLAAAALIVLDADPSAGTEAARALGIPTLRITINPASPAGWLQLRGSAGSAGSAGGAVTDSAALPRPDAPGLLLHTSGTTSRPKLVPLTQANLAASAAHIRDWLGLSVRDRCLNIMPLFHIHGLVGALLSSLAGGGSVICREGFVPTRFLDDVHAFHPTWYTAVPTMHQAILARGELERSRCAGTSLRLIRSSSSSLPPQVAASLEELFGVPVVEAYGMTEAAHQVCCNPLPPAPRKPGSVGLPAGPDVAVMDEHGRLLGAGEMGEVVIRGRNVTSGYAGNPEANRAAFCNGWFRTGDLGRRDEDGYLYLAGRMKEIINRGGEKISPREVDEVLLDHPAVAAAVAFAVPDARLGEEIAAAVVLRDGARISERALMQFASARVADFKVPRRIVFLAEIPKGPTGKVQRIGLARQLGIESLGPAAASPAAPADRQLTGDEAALAAIWCEVLGCASVGANDDFQQLGGDSLQAAQVVARMQSRLGKKLSIVAFFGSPTLASVAAAMEPLTPVESGIQ